MLHHERICTMKNRMRESCTFGTVRGEGSNVLAYSDAEQRHLALQAACRRAPQLGHVGRHIGVGPTHNSGFGWSQYLEKVHEITS